MRVPGITESNRCWWVLRTMAGSLHRCHPVPDDGLNAFGAKASPRLAVLDQAPQLTAV